jgi:hypothetical protein
VGEATERGGELADREVMRMMTSPGADAGLGVAREILLEFCACVGTLARPSSRTFAI